MRVIPGLDAPVDGLDPGGIPWIRNLLKNLANDAGTAVATYRFDNSHHLRPWGGVALFCGYTVVILRGALVSLMRRDA